MFLGFLLFWKAIVVVLRCDVKRSQAGSSTWRLYVIRIRAHSEYNLNLTILEGIWPACAQVDFPSKNPSTDHHVTTMDGTIVSYHFLDVVVHGDCSKVTPFYTDLVSCLLSLSLCCFKDDYHRHRKFHGRGQSFVIGGHK